MLVKAVVVKRDTDDGTNFLVDEVPIGFVYEAETDSIRAMDWYDTRTQKMTRRLCIAVCGSVTTKGSFVGMMPLELFKLEEAVDA